MAEFCDVIYEMKRMCAHFRPTCNGCPLCLEKGTNEFCGEQPLDIRSDPALVEAAVMQWAAEHPEPVYPTWGEWLESFGVVEITKAKDRIIAVMMKPELLNHIPADTAKRLRIEPKEG